MYRIWMILKGYGFRYKSIWGEFFKKVQSALINFSSQISENVKLTLIAAIAACLVENVTKAQPLLWPFGSRSTVHSSIVPWPLNNCLTSFSLYFLLSIPTNNFRSENKRNCRLVFGSFFLWQFSLKHSRV